MPLSDFQHWFEASHRRTAIYGGFLRAQREYDAASAAVRTGDAASQRALVAAAVRLRDAQIEVMYFVRHQRARPRADSGHGP